MSDHSIAGRFPRTLVQIEDMTDGLTSDDPNFYALHKMKQAAQTAVDHGLRTAAEIVDAARAIREGKK